MSNIEIYATDVSTTALAKSKSGVYREHSVRYMDDDLREKYFHTKQEGKTPLYMLVDEIKEMGPFDYFNLMSQAFPPHFDIIFCRNVVIYFEISTIRDIMQKMFLSLNHQGCLFIGYSESLQFITDRFQMMNDGEAIYYRKKNEFGPVAVEEASLAAGEAEPIIKEVKHAEAPPQNLQKRDLSKFLL